MALRGRRKGKRGITGQSDCQTSMNATAPSGDKMFPSTFVLESFFLRQLITLLTKDEHEDMYFLTGPKFGPIRIVSRWADKIHFDHQSPVRVSASARSVAVALIPIIEQGAELHIIAHSHPGRGIGATTPSGIDLACLRKLQSAGSVAIGCIVTRDGHVRFFSALTDFYVMVLGAGVAEVSQHVFKISDSAVG